MWPDTFVQPEVLEYQISDMRNTLGDRAKLFRVEGTGLSPPSGSLSLRNRRQVFRLEAACRTRT